MAEFRQQDKDLIFALDIGTRSIVGVVGVQQDGKLKILAIESAEHNSRTMMDGQIDDISGVAALARQVTERLEARLETRLTNVCVAAAGRALRTQKGSFALEFDENTVMGEAEISRVEAGAVSAAEVALQDGSETMQQFYLVGYTIAQYRLDNYPMVNLVGHSGRVAETDVVATFLPGEVVESLYAAMRAAGLQVASMTLEPIAAMNAAIPAELRLLNLALVDIGAGTSDIALCRDGSVVGYTMATVAGDEITETIMRSFLVDFQTAEQMKRDLEGQEHICYTDILGLEGSVTSDALFELIREPMEQLADAIAQQVLEINSGPPSALFMAGGGSRLRGLKDKLAQSMGMEGRRVALAGNNFAKSVFSDEIPLDNPEYTTPLGIAISAGMGLLNDSYVVLLNGSPAKLFRNGTLKLQEILQMNGYTYEDMVGRTGQGLRLTVDGRTMFFRGESSAPAVLTVNDEEATLNTLIHAGDRLEFIPARHGAPVVKTVADIFGSDFAGRVLVNNQEAALTTQLKHGDVVLSLEKPVASPKKEAQAAPKPAEPKPLRVILNNTPLSLPGKESGEPYYLMDLLERSGIDFQNLSRNVNLLINGNACSFQTVLREGDSVTISMA